MHRAHRRRLSPARQAFTLIELLTVIAIIGILAAIIIPTVGKVRESARTSQCVSNMRQIGLGLGLYANDNKNFLPAATVGGANNWCAALLPYLPRRQTGVNRENAVYVCPASPASYEIEESAISYSYTPMGGFYSQANPFDNPNVARAMSSIATPSRAAWLIDGKRQGTGTAAYAYNSLWQATVTDGSRADFRHGGATRANMLFADSSVRGVQQSEIPALFPDTASWRALR